MPNNEFYHNNFINNSKQVITESVNVWDDDYPSGGNYWSNYTGVDEKSGSNQDELGSDGIGDTPYVIAASANPIFSILQFNVKFLPKL